MNPRMNPPSFPNKPKAKAAKWPFSFNEDWDGWGWSVFFGQLVIAFGLLIFGLTHFAFASRMPGEYDFGTQQNQAVKSNHVEVKGALSWKDGVARIEDGQTGAVYVLSNSGEVKTIYDQGVRNVSVSGILSGSTGNATVATIEVERMSFAR